MDRKSTFSKLDPINTPLDDNIRSIIYYLASQRDKSEWSLDNLWDLSSLITRFIRQTSSKRTLEKWVYPEAQSTQEAFLGLDYPSLGVEVSAKREDVVDDVFNKSIGSPQILKASLSEKEVILQVLRPLSGKKTVLDKLRSGLDGLKTNIAIDKHKILGRLNEKEGKNSKGK